MRVPVARRDGLIVTVLDGETLIYDRTRHVAHRLDAGAAAVWRACRDGADREAVRRALAESLGNAATDDVLAYTLRRLRRARLLLAEPAPAEPDAGLSRREVLRRLTAAGLAAAVPTVLTVAAPNAAAQRVSCVGLNAECNVNKPCCPPYVCAPVGSTGATKCQ